MNKNIEYIIGDAIKFDTEKLVHEYFEEQVKQDPERIALVFEGQEMTYGEVNQKANRLANLLVEKGAKTGQFVGIIVERSFEMIISILAVLKAGAAYLPIDPSHPNDRKKYCFANSQVNLVISYEKYIDEYLKDSAEFIFWDNEEEWNAFSGENLGKRAKGSDIAYIIYTSGSTGKPKGVMIRHDSLTNRLLWMIDNFKFNHKDVFLQKTTYAFDVSVWELLCWGMIGAKLAILKPNKEKNPRDIVKCIEKNGVSVIHFVPSVLELFIEYTKYKFDLSRISSLRYVVVSGEELHVKTATIFNELYKKHHEIELWNLYGPTEATIDVTAYNCNAVNETFERVPIGKAVWNTQLYVMNEENKIVAPGEKGELCIGGVQVSKGYCNNEELTKKSFIPNPYKEDDIIYKTGDLVSINENREIEYHGRIDFQVKIRGLRIELGEIETNLCKYEGITKSVVIVDEHDSVNKYLVAFYQGEKEVEPELLAKFLGERIPHYMVPAKFIRIERFETTLNGKLDKKALNKLYEEEYM